MFRRPFLGPRIVYSHKFHPLANCIFPVVWYSWILMICKSFRFYVLQAATVECIHKVIGHGTARRDGMAEAGRYKLTFQVFSAFEKINSDY